MKKVKIDTPNKTKKNTKRLCGWVPEDIDDSLVEGCVGLKIDKNSHSWCVHQIVEVGQKGSCTSEELSFFLPNFPQTHGSELYFLVDEKDVSSALLPDLIRGCHLIEMKYRNDTGYENGFGSPSPTNNLINFLRKTNKNSAEDLVKWIANNGGNYYVKPMVEERPYPEFKERFRKMNDFDLINIYKEQIGKPGWVRARGYFMSYLREEINSRGLDSDNKFG